MTVQTFIIMTAADKTSAQALNDDNAAVMPRLVDNNLAPADIAGKWVAPARILNDPAYSRWVASLSVLPRQILDADMIFAPVLDA